MTFNKNLNAIDVSCLGELEQTRTHPRVFRKTKMGSAFQLHLGNCGLVYLLRVHLLIGFADAGIVGNEFARRYHVTYNEALALRRWGASKRRHKLIIPTELFHARRVSWLFEKLKGTGGEIIKFI